MSPPLATLDGADHRWAHPVLTSEVFLAHSAAQGADDWNICGFQLGAELGSASIQDAALVVHAAGHRLDVGRTNAATVPAQVIALKAIGDRADQRLVGDAVGKDQPTAYTELAVARLDAMRHPQPAGAEVEPLGRNGADVHLRPEARR